MDTTDAADLVAEVHEAGQDENTRFRNRAALMIAMLAAVLAVAGLGGGNATDDMIFNNIRASDTFVMLADLLGVFDPLERDEGGAEPRRHRHRPRADAAVARPRGERGPGHEKAGGKEDRGVGGADHDFGMRRRCGDASRVQIAVEGIGGEEPAEKQHLGRDKSPDAEFRRLGLMGEVGVLFAEGFVRGGHSVGSG